MSWCILSDGTGLVYGSKQKRSGFKILFSYIVDALFDMPVRYPHGDRNMQLDIWIGSSEKRARLLINILMRAMNI